MKNIDAVVVVNSEALDAIKVLETLDVNGTLNECKWY